SAEPEVARHGINEFGFVELLLRADEVVESFLRPATVRELGTAHRLLKVRIAPRRDAFDVIHHLRNDLATSLWIAPELALCEEKIASGRNKEVVDVPLRRGELDADCDCGREGRLDLRDRQELGVRMN